MSLGEAGGRFHPPFLGRQPLDNVDASHVVHTAHFIRATRDSGYRGFNAALAELIDNSIQADATRIEVSIRAKVSSGQVATAVHDNGVGMSGRELRNAVRFGGSTRFDDRTGLGRFGMGLPNGSLSQSSSFEVYSWQREATPLRVRFDAEELGRGSLSGVHGPAQKEPPSWTPIDSPSGTIVLWDNCDRLPYKRISTLERKAVRSLGQIYRYHLWDGLDLIVNGLPVRAFDPLFLRSRIHETQARLHREALRYDLRAPTGDGIGSVEIRFTCLPIESWAELGGDEKRSLGITGCGGVSFVRANREIDYGWRLMGTKKRENYDDWWRCEVKFDPVLDDLFGVTHNKQGVSPTRTLRESVGRDLGAVARLLNRQVRLNFAEFRKRGGGRALDTANSRRKHLPPPDNQEGIYRKELSIAYVPLADDCFFETRDSNDTVQLKVNSEHAFGAAIHRLRNLKTHKRELFLVEILLLALSRSESEMMKSGQGALPPAMKRRWGDVLATFLDRTP